MERCTYRKRKISRPEAGASRPYYYCSKFHRNCDNCEAKEKMKKHNAFLGGKDAGKE